MRGRGVALAVSCFGGVYRQRRENCRHRHRRFARFGEVLSQHSTETPGAERIAAVSSMTRDLNDRFESQLYKKYCTQFVLCKSSMFYACRGESYIKENGQVF
jgi:hypothetical protein